MAAAATCLHLVDVPKDLAGIGYAAWDIHCCTSRVCVVLIHLDEIDLKSNDDTVEAGPLLTIFNISNSLSGQVCWRKLVFARKAGSEKAIERLPGEYRMCWIGLCLVMKVSAFFSLASPNRVRLG